MLLIFVLLIFQTSFWQCFQKLVLNRCLIPDVCKRYQVNDISEDWDSNTIIGSTVNGLKCDVYNGFQFELNPYYNALYLLDNVEIEDVTCDYLKLFVLDWPSDSTILDKRFNITNMFFLFDHISSGYRIDLLHLKGFDLNLMAEDFSSYENLKLYRANQVLTIRLFGCKMTFYIDKKKMNSCEDILASISTEVVSILQIRKMFVFSPSIYFHEYEYIDIALINNQFISPLCPLVFNNSRIYNLRINALTNTFYKRNILTFSKLNSSKYMVNSDVTNLFLSKVQEIDIDSQLLNPLVFAKLTTLYARGTIRYIEKEAFKSFENLVVFRFYSNNFRKIIHKNGIEWIKSINQDIKINMTDPSQVYNNGYRIKRIVLESHAEHESIKDVFPEEDFCVYQDFPFNQLIFLIKLFDTKSDREYKKFTCTFLWLVQNYKLYHMLHFVNNSYLYIFENHIFYDFYFMKVLDNPNYNSSLSNCFFPKKIDLCNKSNYRIKSVWDTSDYMELNEIFKIVIKILSYIVSLFGIITSLLVIITILHKKNKELFKEFKQFSYLWINSLFNLLIFIIQMLSWMSECFYPYVVFCPEIRKSIFVQVFKMVFKECLINSFRLMCNFTYVAFAFNRISLIDKDHGKFVKFFNTIGKKTYIGICFLISCGFSVIKYFKYEINYEGIESDFPIFIDNRMPNSFKDVLNDVFYILNMINDLLNYVLFEIVTSIIDIYMVLRLRRVLDEKFKQSESLIKDAKKLENMKKEHEEALKKANKMVILNTTISILFRMPIAFLPIINVYAEFYYKADLKLFTSNRIEHPNFDIFYFFLIDSGFYQIINDLSDFLYTFSLSILLFIYLKFDKKFHEGFKCIFSKEEKKK